MHVRQSKQNELSSYRGGGSELIRTKEVHKKRGCFLRLIILRISSGNLLTDKLQIRKGCVHWTCRAISCTVFQTDIFQSPTMTRHFHIFIQCVLHIMLHPISESE